MQALEKIVINTNWISIILVFLFAIIAVLKVIDGDKLKGYVFALFNKGFIEDEVEENTSFFSSFYSLLFIFSSVVLALVISFLVAETNKNTSFSASSFFLILGITFLVTALKNERFKGPKRNNTKRINRKKLIEYRYPNLETT